MLQERVTLTDAEVTFAWQQADIRLADARARHEVHYFQPDEPEHVIYRRACEAEYAAGIGLQVRWYGAGTFETRHDGDLEFGLEVRSAKYDDAFLPIRTNDKPRRPYILVVGKRRTYELRGWKYAADAMQVRYLRLVRGDKAYGVGQRDLRPMRDLYAMVQNWRAKGYSDRREPSLR